MKCRFCGALDSKVVDSRPTEDGFVIRRRRECISCGERITTYEKIEEMPMIIVKKNSDREQYDRGKVLGGIVRACEKRPISVAQMEKIVDDVEAKIRSSMEKEVSSVFVGEAVMEGLKTLDDVAYVRFASVYREFTDVDGFYNELKKLVEEKTMGKK